MKTLTKKRNYNPMYHHVLKGRIVASGSLSDMRRLSKKSGKHSWNGSETNYVLNSPRGKVGDIV